MFDVGRWTLTLLAIGLLLPSPADASGATDGEKRWPAFVRVITAYRTGQVKVWTSDDGKAWNYVSSSAPYLPTEPDQATHPAYLFPLEYLPAYVRVGVTGPFLGRTRVDAVEVLVAGKVRTPQSLDPTGEVIDPENVRAADGKTAVIVHRGQADGIDGFILRCKPSKKPASRRAKHVYFGNYTGPGAAEDRRADAIAAWDFTVFQQGDKLGECVRKVKARNPQHRVVLRLWYPVQSMLLYAYDADARDAIRRQVLGQFAEFAELVATVTLNEEEPGNMMRGIYASPIPPESVWLWRHKFEQETGKPFQWGSNEVNDWMGQKFHDMLNDLYDTIKRAYPKIAVYQWVELRGFGNISGFPEYVVGETLKMDGYVVEWAGVNREELVDTPLGKATVCTNYFTRYVNNLMQRKGLKPSQILGQVWAFDPAEVLPATGQIDAERDVGIEYIYYFWPNAAVPGVFDLYGENGGADWKYANEMWQQFKPLFDATRPKAKR